MNELELPEGFFYESDIPEYRRLFNLVPANGIIAELGVWKGRSLCSVADIIRQKNIQVIAVDHWKGSPKEDIILIEAKQVDIYEQFTTNMDNFRLKPQILRMTTTEAAKQIPDHLLDMIFIDAAHAYEYVSEDIKNWLPKVKVGGIISGHDFSADWPGVVRAVHENFGTNIERGGFVWSHKKLPQ